MADVPRWYRPVTVAALGWNMLGVAAFLSDVTTSAAQVAAMSAAERAMYASRPAWFVAAYAVAVWGGAGSPRARGWTR